MNFQVLGLDVAIMNLCIGTSLLFYLIVLSCISDSIRVSRVMNYSIIHFIYNLS